MFSHVDPVTASPCEDELLKCSLETSPRVFYRQTTDGRQDQGRDKMTAGILMAKWDSLYPLG